MKIISWNINSIRIRLNHIEKLVMQAKPDILALQEIKVNNTDFPFRAIKDLGFKYIETNGEKAYNGVAIFSKIPFEKSFSLNFVNDRDKRHVAIKLFNNLEIHNFYVPSGGEVPDPLMNPKFKHKLEFMDEAAEWFKLNRSSADHLVLLGDLNIAPLEHDVWSHKQMLTEISHTPIEIEKMSILAQSLDWHDAIRQFTPVSDKLYSWWSYRNRDWLASNRGRRLDHIWVTPILSKLIKAGYVLKEFRSLETPSDHVPVVMELDI